MKIVSFLMVLMCTGNLSIAQSETYDIATYEAPAGWKKEIRNSSVYFSKVDGGSWAQLLIYQHTASKGNIEADFQVEWDTLVAKPFSITDAPETTPPSTADGWAVMAGSGVWKFNDANVASMLTTYSNQKVRLSILCNATAKPYLEDYKKLISSLHLSVKDAAVNTVVTEGPVAPIATEFKFNSTNFDDGWVGTVQQEWVQVTKPGINILIHYPNQTADAYNSNKIAGDNIAWNTLVKSKYSSISNLKEQGLQDYQSITFLTADGVDRKTGKNVFIVLFKKHFDKGNGRYMEIVADSKAIFEKEFGNAYINKSTWEYREQAKSWDKLANMQWRNKFALALNDLKGKWSASDYASVSYYYVSGGGYAGATATSIGYEFTFKGDGTYQSDQTGASGVVGNQKFSRQVYNGKAKVDNWTISLSNRFKGATEKFDCYFEAIKGGRILHLTDKNKSTYALVRAR